MITTGVTGTRWRASVTPAGEIEPWDGSATLGWYVAAEDRWHRPAAETAVRQQRLQGTAVTETRVRVPGGDVVQRVFSIADQGGLTVIEIDNESNRPVAVAFDRPDLLTERPVGNVRIEGIDLPDGSFVLPLGHTATVRVGLAHGQATGGQLPGRLPTAHHVARGWTSLARRASRIVLPDLASALTDRVTAERCELALGAVPDADDDPAGFAIALGELVRLGDDPDDLLPELVHALARLGPDRSWDARVAFAAAGRVLAAAGERRALRDLDRMTASRRWGETPSAAPGGVRLVSWVEGLLADGAELLPRGFLSGWLGQPLEVFGVPTGRVSSVSYAVRWHGARPALLWEQSGTPVRLAAPAVAPEWSSGDVTGEVLWPEPAGGEGDVGVVGAGGRSFGDP